MREKLLDYLVGGLGSKDCEQVRKALKEDPLLQQELELLKTSLQPLDTCRHYEPPAGLKDKAVDYVMQTVQQDEATGRSAVARQQRDAWSNKSDDSAVQRSGSIYAGSRWTMLDVVVAGAILMTAGMLVFPLILNSRYSAQLRGCQNNLQQIGMALHDYSTTHDGFFPHPSGDSNWSVAGAYAPVLYHNKFVNRPRLFLCPAAMDNEKWSDWEPPSQQQLLQSTGTELVKLQNRMGGSYGYNLGYETPDGRYFPPRNLHRPFYPVMADVPSSLVLGRSSKNHGGNGQNVLFEDGHVQYMINSQHSPRNEAIFFSDRGRVEPGRRRNDAVIGESNQRVSNR